LVSFLKLTIAALHRIWKRDDFDKTTEFRKCKIVI